MADNNSQNGHYKAAGIIGILILLCGIGDCITGFFWIATFTSHGFKTDGSGIWSGVPLIIAGALGIAAWPKRNRGMMIGFLVMCIIACILTSIQAIVAGLAHAIWVTFTGNEKCYSTGSSCICNSNRGQRVLNDPRSCDLIIALVAGLLAFIIFSAFGAILTLVGSIVGCIVACGSQPSGGTVIVQQPATTGVIITSQQTTYPNQYPQQPMQGYVPQQPIQGYPQQAAAPPQYAEKPAGVM